MFFYKFWVLCILADVGLFELFLEAANGGSLQCVGLGPICVAFAPQYGTSPKIFRVSESLHYYDSSDVVAWFLCHCT